MAGRLPELGTLRVERVTRIELALSAWEADVLPLNYTRGHLPGLDGPADVVPTSYRKPLDALAGTGLAGAGQCQPR
jgi:hypothetical protein